jgi:hypothetical protein
MAKGVLVIALAQSWGCGTGPRNFRRIQNPAPLVRARSVGLGEQRPDTQVIPALIKRLEDPDPVVRLAAHEELRKRTGRDFGFVPWASPEERSAAIGRWWGWFQASAPGAAARSGGTPPVAGTSPPVAGHQPAFL